MGALLGATVQSTVPDLLLRHSPSALHICESKDNPATVGLAVF